MILSQIHEKIIALAAQNSDIEVLWLYGSQATGQAGEESDFDFAVAFKDFIKDPLARALRPQKLGIQWTSSLGLSEKKLSIIDINYVPVPLAWEVISKGKVIYHTESGRQYWEFDRISRQFELDVFYHRQKNG